MDILSEYESSGFNNFQGMDMSQFDSYDYSDNSKQEEVVVTTTTAEPTTTTTETPLVDECANGTHNCDANAVCFDEIEVRYNITFYHFFVNINFL